MNAKRVKQLRKKALELAIASDLPYVAYEFKQFRKTAMKLDGTIIPYAVYTAFLGDSQRKIYKALKKESK